MATEPSLCACGDCNCTVDPRNGIDKNGMLYCCEACADGHADGKACAHEGCACHGS